MPWFVGFRGVLLAFLYRYINVLTFFSLLFNNREKFRAEQGEARTEQGGTGTEKAPTSRSSCQRASRSFCTPSGLNHATNRIAIESTRSPQQPVSSRRECPPRPCFGEPFRLYAGGSYFELLFSTGAGEARENDLACRARIRCNASRSKADYRDLSAIARLAA